MSFFSTILARQQKINTKFLQSWKASTLVGRHRQHLSITSIRNRPMELPRVHKILKCLASPTLAANWDNVGMLIEPTPPHTVNTILLTNDLTEAVMEEALERKADLILSYHPPIFVPLKRLTQSMWKERIVLKCVENRIALYSPHTSWDVVPGGVNDWLASAFEGKTCVLESQRDTMFAMAGPYRLEFSVESTDTTLVPRLEKLNCVQVVYETPVTGSEPSKKRVALNCTEKSLSQVMDELNKNQDIRNTVEIFKGEKPPLPNHGVGRLVTLATPITVQEAVTKVKNHLKLPHVRLALASGATLESKVKKVALCAGSGRDTLRGVNADLYLTGEMSHHDVMEANHRDASVILCDHSNTERGFLHVFSEKLQRELEDSVTILISERDKDPLDIV